MQWLASFDTKGYGTYIMEAGNYYFAVGSSAHDAVNNILAAKGANVNGSAALTYTWNQAETDASTYAKSLYTGESITASFPDADINPGGILPLFDSHGDSFAKEKTLFSATASHAGDKHYSFQTMEQHLGVHSAALYPQIFDFIRSGDCGHDAML